jgi:hypothetical protein
MFVCLFILWCLTPLESGVKHHKINKQTNIITLMGVPGKIIQKFYICVRKITV